MPSRPKKASEELRTTGKRAITKSTKVKDMEEVKKATLNGTRAKSRKAKAKTKVSKDESDSSESEQGEGLVEDEDGVKIE